MPLTVLRCVIDYIEASSDLNSIALVCKSWYLIDKVTRKHANIDLCYTTTPEQLVQRFEGLESVKLKGLPLEKSEFRLSLPEPNNFIPDWGRDASPWAECIAKFSTLKHIQFKRMFVMDADLYVLALSPRGKVFESIKMDSCYGFSTKGLSKLAQFCKNLKTFLIQKCVVEEYDGDWIKLLALSNSSLEKFSLYRTNFEMIQNTDLTLLAIHNPALISVKLGNKQKVEELSTFLGAASNVREFFASSGKRATDGYVKTTFPRGLCSIGLSVHSSEESILYPVASQLKILNLLHHVTINEDGYRVLIPKCPNLEVLEATSLIGDTGLASIAHHCKKLKFLRIKEFNDKFEMYDDCRFVSEAGLILIARGCLKLETLSYYVARGGVTNTSLECVGECLKSLTDFRLYSFYVPFPLDNGVQALLQGCNKLRRLSLCLKEGALTNVGLAHIGEYSKNVSRMRLSNLIKSDAGLLEFSKGGCPNLQKLELNGCRFSKKALASAALRLPCLRYHVAGTEGVFYAQEPYPNVEAGHVTCFFSHDAVGNKDKQERHKHGEGDDNRLCFRFLCSGSCPRGNNCHFQHNENAREQCRRGVCFDFLNKEKCEKGPECSFMHSLQEEGSKLFRSMACWFCLSSPCLQYHLIAGLSKHYYCALAKGPLIEDHLLIIPIEHTPTTLTSSPQSETELIKFQTSFKMFFKNQRKDVIFFEWVSNRSTHANLQVIPIPSSRASVVQKIFNLAAQRLGFNFKEIKNDSSEGRKFLQTLYNRKCSLFYAELPGGTLLYHPVEENEKFPAQFGREVLAGLLNKADKDNWKNSCELTVEEEEAMAESFRKRFEKYDPTR